MANSNGMVHANVPFFKGENYEQWWVQMKVFLEYQEVLEVVEKGLPDKLRTNSERKAFLEAKKKDRKALYFIHQGIETKIFQRIMNSITAKDAWETLERIYMVLPLPFPIPEFTGVQIEPLPPLTHFPVGNTPTPRTGVQIEVPPLPTHFPVDNTPAPQQRVRRVKDITMCNAVLTSDWKAAEAVLNEFPDIVYTNISQFEQEPLHIAVTTKQKYFVEKLLERMKKDDLERQDTYGNTALHAAAAAGTKEIAELLLAKNPQLPLIYNYDKMLPLSLATVSGHREMVLYLYYKTDLKQLKSHRPALGELFLKLILGGTYDLALKTLQIDKSLALFRDDNKWTALHWFVESQQSKTSWQSQQGVCKRFINSCCKSIFHDASMGTSAHQLVEDIWKEVIKLEENEIDNFVDKPFNFLFSAAKAGNVEFLLTLLRYHPKLIRVLDQKNRSLFHVAAKRRQESVFSVLYETSLISNSIMILHNEDGTNDSILHLVARLPRSERLNIVSGAALQMQREIIWFEAMNNIVPVYFRRLFNNDDYTPEGLFAIHHKELQKEGEKWMKDTATSCMLVATLVATVVFAAAFTVPGGNNQDTGIPIFERHNWFTIFAVSDAIALSTSSISIMFFLSILTSRYAISDFRRSLPLKLMFGLLALAISISAMLLAFSASFFVVYHKKASWIPISNISLVLIPTMLYIVLHGGILFDIIRSAMWSRTFFKSRANKLFPRKHPSLLSRILRSRFCSFLPIR